MLSKSETKKGLYILKITDYIEDTKETAEYLLKGKGFILFLMSSFVWTVEIYSFRLLSRVFETEDNFNTIVLNWLKNTRILNMDVYTLSWITFLFSAIFIIKYSKNRILDYMKGAK